MNSGILATQQPVDYIPGMLFLKVGPHLINLLHVTSMEKIWDSTNPEHWPVYKFQMPVGSWITYTAKSQAEVDELDNLMRILNSNGERLLWRLGWQRSTRGI